MQKNDSTITEILDQDSVINVSVDEKNVIMISSDDDDENEDDIQLEMEESKKIDDVDAEQLATLEKLRQIQRLDYLKVYLFWKILENFLNLNLKGEYVGLNSGHGPFNEGAPGHLQIGLL